MVAGKPCASASAVRIRPRSLAFLDYATITIEADIVEGRCIAWYVPGLARRLTSVHKAPHRAFSFQAI
jgi:hypothetical protein